MRFSFWKRLGNPWIKFSALVIIHFHLSYEVLFTVKTKPIYIKKIINLDFRKNQRYMINTIRLHNNDFYFLWIG